MFVGSFFVLSYTVGQCFYIVSKRRIMYIMYSLKLWKVGRCVVVVKCVVFRVIVLLFVSCDFFNCNFVWCCPDDFLYD